jgi:hypothetical protein
LFPSFVRFFFIFSNLIFGISSTLIPSFYFSCFFAAEGVVIAPEWQLNATVKAGTARIKGATTTERIAYDQSVSHLSWRSHPRY